jgi:hexosaminidase
MSNFKPRVPQRLYAMVISAVALAGLSSIGVAHTLMPVPAELQFGTGRLALQGNLTVAVQGHDDARLRGGLARALRRWEERTGLTFARTLTGEYASSTEVGGATLLIECKEAGHPLPALDEDESYILEVDGKHAHLRAPTVVGGLRGLETLLQLLQSDDAGGWFLPAVSIHDHPRFPWRGLMIDVCRHWQPIEVIERNLDGMALVKLNVFHFHLSEDQGFRIESKTHPELQERGSDGHFFTQVQIRTIIDYAAARGIRVVPEFDIPGHATSWVVSHPELASAPGPYGIERRWGVFDPVLDPTNEATYALLTDFLGEMAELFPDPYFHIGGDENNGVQWDASPHIQAFIREHNLKDNAGLHAYFNRRVHAILAVHGKRLVGWDEVLHPDLPADSVIHSWRGAEGLAEATHRGYATILSNGFYIDLCFPASQHYLNDPVPSGTPLTPAEQARVLGGEATMWSEWVSPETIDSRIWPRTAAVAERLWSPREVTDVPDMYRRLSIVSRRLEEAGLNHERNRDSMLRRLAGDNATPADLANLATFVDVIEPVKHYERGVQQPGSTQFTPLTSFADCARPESDSAREFAKDVEEFLVTPAAQRTVSMGDTLARQLAAWKNAGAAVATLVTTHSPRAQLGAPVAQALADASQIGLVALEAFQKNSSKDSAWREAQFAELDRCGLAHDAIELPVIKSIRRLVAAAAQPITPERRKP